MFTFLTLLKAVMIVEKYQTLHLLSSGEMKVCWTHGRPAQLGQPRGTVHYTLTPGYGTCPPSPGTVGGTAWPDSGRGPRNCPSPSVRSEKGVRVDSLGELAPTRGVFHFRLLTPGVRASSCSLGGCYHSEDFMGNRKNTQTVAWHVSRGAGVWPEVSL